MAEDFSPAGGKTAFNVYAEFKEFNRKQIQHYQKMFKHYDLNHDQYIDEGELSSLMEKIKYPLSGEEINEMIREIDEDQDGRISFRDMMVMFRKGRNNELVHMGWHKAYKQIHVDTS